MAILTNPGNEQHELSVLAQGLLATDRFTFDLSKPYAAGATAANTQIVIGHVPTDCVLVPHLSTVSIPALDTDGDATAKVKLGTFDDDAALLGETAAGAPVVKFGHELIQAEGIGSQVRPTAIVLTVSAAAAAAATTGVIQADLVFRAFNPMIDS